MSKDASTVISCKMPSATGSKLRSIVYCSGADNVIIRNNDIIRRRFPSLLNRQQN